MSRSSLHVLSIVSYSVLPAHTGGQKGIALFNKYLSERVDLHCVTTKANANELADYKTIPLFPGSKFRYVNPVYVFILGRYIRKNGISHVILEHSYFGWLGLLLKYFYSIKLIVHSHNIESVRWRGLGKWWWRILYEYEKIVCRKADHCFFVTDEDRRFAETHFRLSKKKCITVTYGTEISRPPSLIDGNDARSFLRNKYCIGVGDVILLFNGAFNYAPNLKALESVLTEINPLLQKESAFGYKIIICGKYLPEELVLRGKFPDIIFAGFVDDIAPYLRGAGVFINPVTDGGGIKTKLVEALAYNLSCVSFKSGAVGIPPEITGNKMLVSEDEDFGSFCKNIIEISRLAESTIPDQFYDRFYWGSIIENCVSFLEHPPDAALHSSGLSALK